MNDVRDVVLLHGWGYSARVWDELAGRLARRFRVHAPDLPGYGSAPPCAPYTLAALAATLARAAPRRCHVVGWSLGGEVALAWAARAPRQVVRLALIATTPCFARRPGWPCATPAPVLAEFGHSLAADRGGTLGRFVGAQGKGDARRRRVAGVLERAVARDASSAVLAAGLAILAAADLRPVVSRLRQPVLVVHGARDRIVSPVAGRRLAGLPPLARFCLLRSCGHAPFVSRPRQVAALLGEFFDG
jgi:pimeloyl-[acyl-carrier protein] methyl ester esterase